MKRIFGISRYTSEKNGEVEVQHIFGRPDTYVDGVDQSTWYMRALWKEALRSVDRSPKSVLMLGLGTGIGIREIRKRLPGASITVVEWDPVMIKLFHELRPNEQVEIVQGDVRDVLAPMHRTFDLVLVDLFQGHDPAPALFEDGTIKGIAGVMNSKTICMVNAYEAQDLFLRFDQYLKRVKTWKVRANHMATYVRYER